MKTFVSLCILLQPIPNKYSKSIKTVHFQVVSYIFSPYLYTSMNSKKNCKNRECLFLRDVCEGTYTIMSLSKASLGEGWANETCSVSDLPLLHHQPFMWVTESSNPLHLLHLTSCVHVLADRQLAYIVQILHIHSNSHAEDYCTLLVKLS